MAASDDTVRNLIYRSCLLLDDENYGGYLNLCSSEFTYKIIAYSPEIRKQMTWMEHDRKEMSDLFGMLPKHVRMPGEFTRHANVYMIESEENDKHALVTTSVIVMYTDLDGVSRVFAVGRYCDTVDVSGEIPLLEVREVRVKTRDLSPGSHIPI